MLKMIPLLLAFLFIGQQAQAQNHPISQPDPVSLVVLQDTAQQAAVVYDQEYYDKALAQKKSGTILTTIGIGCAAAASILMRQENTNSQQLGKVLLFGGTVSMGVGIPQWVVGNAKARDYEQAQLKQKKNLSLTMAFTSDGLGLVMRL